FGELANRRASDEDESFDRNAGALAHFDHRRDVADDGASRAARLDAELRARDRLAHSNGVLERALGAAGEADVGGMDADVVHEMQDLDLGLDRRIDDARI